VADGRPGRLPAAVVAAYGLPGLPLAALTLPVYIYLPAFYAGDMALGLAGVGTVLLLARLFDVVSDPLAGYWCDRLGLRFGRRRTWVAAATPLVMLAVWYLFMPAAGVGLGYLLGWTLALYLGWTLLLLPYTAWGAELSADYNERSRVVAAREAAVVVGTCVAAAMPALVSALAPETASAKATALAWVGWLTIVLLPLALLLALRLVPEPAPVAAARLPLGPGLRAVWRNGPFRQVLGAYLLNGSANGLTATLFLLFVEHRLGLPDRAGLLLLVYFLAGVVSVPLWLRLSYRFGKHRTWAAGMAATALGFLAVPLLGPGDFWPFLAICVATGLCLGADLALPASMQADVVDYDTLRSGAQRTGFYFALWSMATKLALALAVGIAFPLLELAGFRTDGANDPGALLALALLYGLLPVPIKLAAILCIRRFPIDAKRQARLRARIERRALLRPAAPGGGAPAR